MKALDVYTIEQMKRRPGARWQNGLVCRSFGACKEGLPLSKVLVLCGSGNNGARRRGHSQASDPDIRQMSVFWESLETFYKRNGKTDRNWQKLWDFLCQDFLCP